MGEDRARILNMVANGKISVAEAEALLDALEEANTPFNAGPKTKDPKFLYVKMESSDGDNVDVRIPLALLRAGMRLTSLIPSKAMAQISDQIREHGVEIDLKNLKPEDLEQLVDHLRELEVKVNAANGETVRVYCE